ncbi:MAG: hypothetical protein KAR45_10570, partial [Desulfobacteraceae bacterium]|nr:hypothetical protein [Desulfobacteraceae bacterium]
FHFTHEVRFLEKYSLSTQSQETEHDIFLTALSEQKKKIMEDSFDDMVVFIDFLLTWWIEHINGIDYVEFHFSRIAGPVFEQSHNSNDFQWMIRKTGIDQIDEEHVQLIDLLLKLKEPENQKEKSFDVRIELNKIYEFAALHFRHEEKIMEAAKLKGHGIQQETHSKMLRNIHEAITHAVSGRSRVSPIFHKRLMRWWVEHTNGMDYETFVLNKTLI